MLTNKQDLIINARQVLTYRQRAVSWLLALIGWGTWVYLWLPALAIVTHYQAGHARLADRADQTHLAHGGSTLAVYAMIALVLGAMLAAWAGIHYRRFSGVERRASIADVPLDEIAAVVSLPPCLLRDGQMAQILQVEHGPDGGIVDIYVQQPLIAESGKIFPSVIRQELVQEQ